MALATQDGILLAADQLETRGSTFVTAGSEVAAGLVHKLNVAGTRGVMWGYAGQVDGIGLRFGNWIADKTWTDWATLEEDVRSSFRSITKEERQSHHDFTDRPFDDSSLDTQLLLAGHLEGIPRIMRLSHVGGIQHHDSADEPIFVGSGESAFLIAWRMLLRHALVLKLQSPEGIREFLEHSTKCCFGTSPPVDIWMLKPGVDPVHIPAPI